MKVLKKATLKGKSLTTNDTAILYILNVLDNDSNVWFAVNLSLEVAAFRVVLDHVETYGYVSLTDQSTKFSVVPALEP
jgi:hypothetical protein